MMMVMTSEVVKVMVMSKTALMVMPMMMGGEIR